MNGSSVASISVILRLIQSSNIQISILAMVEMRLEETSLWIEFKNLGRLIPDANERASWIEDMSIIKLVLLILPDFANRFHSHGVFSSAMRV